MDNENTPPLRMSEEMGQEILDKALSKNQQ